MYQIVRTDKNPILDDVCMDSIPSSFQGAWDDCRELNGPAWAALASQQGFSEEVLNTATYLPYQLIPVIEADEKAYAYTAYFAEEDFVGYFNKFETAKNWAHEKDIVEVYGLFTPDYAARAKFNQSFIQE